MTSAREIAERICDDWFGPGSAPHLSEASLIDDIESALLAERRRTIEEAAKEGIACAHELKRNADLEAEDSPERCALLSEALIAFDVVARIRSLASPGEETEIAAPERAGE
jgi:hypothetical protein